MMLHVTPGEMKCSVAFTGYRPSKLPFLNNPDSAQYKLLYHAVYSEVERLINRGYRFFLTGGALGCDLMAAEAVIRLKKKYRKKMSLMSFACLALITMLSGVKKIRNALRKLKKAV